MIVCALLSFGQANAQTNLTICTEGNLAQALQAGGVVNLACDGTIFLTGTIVISTNVTLDAADHRVTISGENVLRLFQVNSQSVLTLKNLTLAQGKDGDDSTNAPPGVTGKGGAIYNQGGTVVLVNCVLSDHRAVGSDGASGENASSGNGAYGSEGGGGLGGAIYNDGGTLIATNTVFSGNQATGGKGGSGGSGSEGGNGNHGGRGGSGGNGVGGAIYNTAGGRIEVMDCTFSSNRVAGAAGGVGGVGGGFLGFDGTPGAGGPGHGAGIFNAGGKVVIGNSTFFGNTGVGVTGNNGNPGRTNADGLPGEPGSDAQGAGLFNNGGQIALTNCTFFGNVLVGGNGGDGGAGGQDAFGGDGGSGGSGGNGNGAGLYNTAAGTVTLVNCTVASNVSKGGVGGAAGSGGGATGRDGEAGASSPSVGAGIFNQAGMVTLKNTILAHATGGGNCGGVITDGGNNLSSDATAQFQKPTSRNDIDPKLSPLASNGGRTQTMALALDSPAIDAGDDLAAPRVDQRQAQRVGIADIGAYEFNAALREFALGIRFEITGEVTVSWPKSDLALVLESTDAFVANAVWNPHPNAPLVVGNENRATFAPADQSRFYRLRKP